MGHRANFVIIRNGRAAAYHDQWAALGSTYAFAPGPEEAAAFAEQAERTDALLDWAFAEAGYLVDFDERVAIVFGQPETFGDYQPEDVSPAQSEELRVIAALEKGPRAFLESISFRWPGWFLHWDERGVDAFSAHLDRRQIRSIVTQRRAHPDGCFVCSVRAEGGTPTC